MNYPGYGPILRRNSCAPPRLTNPYYSTPCPSYARSSYSNSFPTPFRLQSQNTSYQYPSFNNPQYPPVPPTAVQPYPGYLQEQLSSYPSQVQPVAKPYLGQALPYAPIPLDHIFYFQQLGLSSYVPGGVSSRGLEIILIAILILVALDFIVVRPIKRPLLDSIKEQG